MAKKAVKVVGNLTMVILAAFLVYFALKGIEWNVFVDNLSDVRWGYVLLSALASLLAIILRNERWHSLLVPLDGESRRLTSWDASNIGSLSYLAIPGVGEFIRGAGVTTKKASYDKVLGTIVMERAWDALMVVVVTILAIALKSGTILGFIKTNMVDAVGGSLSWRLWLGAALIAIVGIAAFVLIYKFRDKVSLFGKIIGWLQGLFIGFKSFGAVSHKGKFIVESILIWWLYVEMCQLCFMAIPALNGLDFADALFISAIGNVASIIPVPGGMGAYHYLVATALSSIYCQSWELGILFATLTHESRSVLLIVLGIESAISIALQKNKTKIAS